MFSVIIPVYNRIENLKLCLAALASQINPPAFEVIISDDGSTDGTKDFVERLKNLPLYTSLNLKYVSCGPHNGFRPHRTRNIGIAQASYSYIILLDSDILLNPKALSYHKAIREKHPDIVVIGMYHFAENNNLTERDLLSDYKMVEKLVPDRKSSAPPSPGLDCRIDAFTDNPDSIITKYDGLGFFGGNQCWPLDLFWKLGGYDENMPSGMGEDAELGQRMRLADVPVLQYQPVFGIHLPHERNVEESQRLVQLSIKFIDKKYKIGTYAELTNPETDPREKNLSLWYTKDYGAKVVKKDSDPTVYAIDGTGKWYVGIPSPEWLNLLDFSFDDVKTVEDSYFDGISYEGTIKK